MTRFIDAYLDPCVPGYPCLSSPRWSTSIVQVDSGMEKANQRWEHPLYRFELPEAVREHQIYEAVRNHWLVMRGPAYTFPFRDPLDFASVPLVYPNVVPTISNMDQVLGTGDGINLTWQLTKSYVVGGQEYKRVIVHPVVASVVLSVNGAPSSEYESSPGSGVFMTFTVDRTTGGVTTSFPVQNGHVVRAGFLFDVEVRFEDDNSFDGVLRTYQVSGFADLTLVEVRPC